MISAISHRAKAANHRQVIELNCWHNASQQSSVWVVVIDPTELMETCGMVTALGRRLLAGTGYAAVAGRLLSCPL